MPLYTEPFLRNAKSPRGKPRISTVLGGLPGAVGRGFDGDGTPSKRGRPETGRRIWFFEKSLRTLPEGVKKITRAQYDAIDTTREQTRPVPPPPPPPPRDLAAELDALQARLDARESV